MFSKGFILSLGLSLCAVVLVYLYVKNRITNLENKVDSLIEIIQVHQRLSQQVGGTQQFEKIVVSDDESEEEDDSSEEENDEEETEEQQETLVLENHVVEKENDIKEEVEQQMLQLSNNEEVLKDMEEHEVAPKDDGLDEMDDLEENLDDEENDEDSEENDEDSEEQDYSKLGKVQLRELCEGKGFDVKGKKKHELLELLK